MFCLQILVGCLRNSSKTGQLNLLDQTGEINCMIAPAGHLSAGHDCARSCCKIPSVKVESSNCPYTQAWHSGAMIQITKFEVAIEKFQSSNPVQENFTEDGNRTYLQFSFDNAEILIPKDTSKKADSQSKSRNFGNKKEKTETCGKDASTDTGLNEICDGKNNGFMCKVMFMVRNCEVPTLRKVKEELCFPCGVEIKIVAVHRNDIQKVIAKKGSSSSERNVCYSSSSCNVLSDFQLQRKNAALKLVKKSLCWSQALHPGCFYVITETVPNEASSRILKNGQLEPLINVSSDMQLERVCWCDSCRIAAISRDTENRAEIVKALDELKDDFLRNDNLCAVDTVLSDTVGDKDESENSLQPRYGMHFVYLQRNVVSIFFVLNRDPKLSFLTISTIGLFHIGRFHTRRRRNRLDGQIV